MKPQLIIQDEEYLTLSYKSLCSSLGKLITQINKQIRVINKTNWLSKDTIKLDNLKKVRKQVDALISDCNKALVKVTSSDLTEDLKEKYFIIKKAYMAITIEYT